MIRLSLAAMAAACLLALVFPIKAPAFTLGAGDRADADPSVARSLGARVYRLVLDPARPLSDYDARIYKWRAGGLEPQLVVGGTGTRDHASMDGVVEYAVAAYRRWPFAFSVSVINEPDLSGVSVCGYARTYARAYRALRRLGARVLFGEFSPYYGVAWTDAILTRCHTRITVDRFAWHAYGWREMVGSIGNTRALRDYLRSKRHELGGHTPRLYVTEFGIEPKEGEVKAMRRWRKALMVAGKYLSELVAWDIHSPDPRSKWDTSLIEPSGRQRPAFHVIRRAVAR